MSLIIKKIETILKKSVSDIFDFSGTIIIEKSRNSTFGDYSTNIAMMLASKMKMAPAKIGAEIIARLETDSFFKKVVFVNPGFINLTVNDVVFSAVINKILNEKNDFGRGPQSNIKYNLEIVSANPTGVLHIGHARNGAIADAVARILKFAGFKVETEYYINDAGNQINILANTVFTYYLKLCQVPTDFLEAAYQGHHYEVLAQSIVAEYGDQFSSYRIVDDQINNFEVRNLFKTTAVAFFLKLIKQQLRDFRITIDTWISETTMYQNETITKVLATLVKSGTTYEAEGALWLKTSDYGDDKDRVLIKKDETYAYILPDLAAHNLRIARTKANYLVNFWGADHHSYINRITAGLQILGYNPQFLKIVIIQMVRLIKDNKEYKMSKRQGTAVWLEDLMNEIGIDAVRYMLCAKVASNHMDLDLDVLVTKNNNNPVYYFQYATARCASILRNKPDAIDLSLKIAEFDLLTHPKERELIKIMDYFGIVVAMAAKTLQPHLVCEYIQELAKGFHSYYGECQILDKDNLAITTQRLNLINALTYVFRNALNLIAVDFKDKM